MKKLFKKTMVAATLASSMFVAQPAFALGEFADLKIHTLECAGILISDIVNGTSNHPTECGTGGTATSNYGGHTSGASKTGCYDDKMTKPADIYCPGDIYCCVGR